MCGCAAPGRFPAHRPRQALAPGSPARRRRRRRLLLPDGEEERAEPAARSRAGLVLSRSLKPWERWICARALAAPWRGLSWEGRGGEGGAVSGRRGSGKPQCSRSLELRPGPARPGVTAPRQRRPCCRRRCPGGLGKGRPSLARPGFIGGAPRGRAGRRAIHSAGPRQLRGGGGGGGASAKLCLSPGTGREKTQA